MKSLFPYLAPYGKRMGVGLSIKIGGTIVELFLPLTWHSKALYPGMVFGRHCTPTVRQRHWFV